MAETTNLSLLPLLGFEAGGIPGPKDRGQIQELSIFLESQFALPPVQL